MDEAINPTVSPEPETEENRRVFKTHECVFAWLCLLGAFFYCESYPILNEPLGGFIYLIFLFTVSTVVLKIRSVKPDRLSVAAAISGVVVGCALIICSNAFLRFLAFNFSALMFCYYLYSAMGNSIKKGFSDLLLMDFFKALVIMPFTAFSQLLRALFSGRARKGGRALLKVLIGVCCAAVPALLIFSLLSYDSGFMALCERIFDFRDFNLARHLVCLVFSIPVGMYLFGAFIASADRKCADFITEESCGSASQKIKVAPLITVLAASLPIIFIYVVFFVSQWSYYISGFTGVLPENFSHAEYAREGFFQLCSVSVINLALLSAIALFMKRKNRAAALVFKALALIFSIFTLILISTAIAKLVMYIDRYGLTTRRVLAAWFMAVLAIVFILVAIKQFVSRLKLVAISFCILVVMFAGLSLSNVDGYIARYNVDRYVEGSLDAVDFKAMDELGLAAVPEIVRLGEIMETTVGADPLYPHVRSYLERVKIEHFNESDPAGIFEYTLPYLKAKKALEAGG